MNKQIAQFAQAAIMNWAAAHQSEEVKLTTSSDDTDGITLKISTNSTRNANVIKGETLNALGAIATATGTEWGIILFPATKESGIWFW